MDFEFSGFVDALRGQAVIIERLHIVDGLTYDSKVGVASREMGEKGQGE